MLLEAVGLGPWLRRALRNANLLLRPVTLRAASPRLLSFSRKLDFKPG